MARIPEEEIERLKREVSLERLVEARGVVLSQRGADLVGCCPFHDDQEPSLVITPSKNLWHCLGACQRGGSVIDWVMKAESWCHRKLVESWCQVLHSHIHDFPFFRKASSTWMMGFRWSGGSFST